MDDSERDEILYRLDERTELIQTDVSEVKEKASLQDTAIRSNRRVARDNRKILNVMTFGIGSLVTAGIAKLGGLIKL